MELHHRGTETQSFIMYMTDQRDPGQCGKNMKIHHRGTETQSFVMHMTDQRDPG